jgi:hypothetical protein
MEWLSVLAFCLTRMRAESNGRVSDLVASLMEQLNQAAALTDVGVADVAKEYLDNPSLQPFSVPRFSLSDVAVDLKMAVAPSSDTREDQKQSLQTVRRCGVRGI